MGVAYRSNRPSATAAVAGSTFAPCALDNMCSSSTTKQECAVPTLCERHTCERQSVGRMLRFWKNKKTHVQLRHVQCATRLDSLC